MSKASTSKIREIASSITNDCLALRVRQLNRLVTSIYDDAFRPFGITAGQVIMLVGIVNQGTLSPSELSRILNIEKSTLSRNLERMRKAGWIEISVPTLGKMHTIQASDEGEALLLRVLPHWQKAQDDTTRLLGEDGSVALLNVVNHVESEISSSR